MAQTEAELLDNPVEGQPTLILRSPDFHSITEAVAGPVEVSGLYWRFVDIVWIFLFPLLYLIGYHYH